MTLIKSLARRCWAPAVLGLAVCLLAAGCGGGSGSRTHTFPGRIRPIGPADLGTNVTQLIAKAQPYLKHVKPRCPSGPARRFPVLCPFTAVQAAPLPGSNKKKSAQNFPGPYRVAGTIRVFGVYARTRTYEYQLNYAPTH